MHTKLEKIIKENGYNINSFSKAVGINRSNIYNHVRGYGIIGMAKARKIAKFLNISLDDVYAEN